jgi:hypothetical protein
MPLQVATLANAPSTCVESANVDEVKITQKTATGDKYTFDHARKRQLLTRIASNKTCWAPLIPTFRCGNLLSVLPA